MGTEPSCALGFDSELRGALALGAGSALGLRTEL